jgi:hypothetical protein
MAKLVLPRVHAMVLCDGVRESEDEEGVFDLTGVRTVIETSSFPAMCPRLCVFLQASGHRGEAYLHVEIEQPGTDDVLHSTKQKVIFFEDPASVTPVLFRMRNCVFPVEGLYYVQVFHDSKLIGERVLLLTKGE